MGLLKRGIEGLATLFGNRKRNRRPVPRGARGAAARKPSLDENLNNMLEITSPVAAGAVFWLGLKEFRDRFSDRWHIIEPKVHAVARHCIEKRLTDAEDSFDRHGDNYAIIFAKLSKAQAHLQCALIAKDISDWLVGERDLKETVSVGSTVIEIDKKIAKKAVAEGGVGEVLEKRARHANEESKKRKAESVADFPEKTLAKIELIYQPMWNTRRNVVSSYRCVPTRVSGDGRLLMGEELVPAWDPHTGFSARAMVPLVDVFVLKKAISVLKTITANGHKNVLVVPVHLSTLREKILRDEYKGILKTISADLTNLMVFAIRGADDPGDFVGLLDPILLLKPNCRAVILDQPISRKNFDGLENIGLHSVGVDVGLLKEPEASAMSKLLRFTEHANKAGFGTYVHGVQTLSLATAAVGAGYDFVSGMAITSMDESMLRPQGIHEFTLRDLFSCAYAKAHGTTDKIEKMPDVAPVEKEPEPKKQASEEPDELTLLTRHYMKENGLAEEDAQMLATTKLGRATQTTV